MYLHWGLGAGGWVLLGWTGLVLLCTAQNPARLVYGSAALVASLRGQQSHFATLPKRKKKKTRDGRRRKRDEREGKKELEGKR